MPDRISGLILVALIGGSLLINWILFHNALMPLIIAFCAGLGLALSPDHSFVQLWRRSPTIWRVFPFIFVAMAMVLPPPPGGVLIGRLLLGMMAASAVLLLLSLAHLIIGDLLGLIDSDK